MKILGWQVPFTKALTDQNTVTPIQAPVQLQSRWGLITEAFGGMWQRHLHIDDTQSLLAFSAVFACISLISGDVAKLRIKLQKRTKDGIWEETESSAFSPVLRKPNRYQTRLQFIEQWLICKLIWGNVYVLKERDDRQVVVAMYILDPSRVNLLLAPDGEVLYRMKMDTLAGVEQETAVPASEIIHDRGKCLFHPLIGVAPLWACALSTSQGRRIQQNAATFFENMSRPSGMLTAPGTISDEVAARMKGEFERNFSGANLGRLLVGGDGLAYTAMTMPAQQSQLIEQLGWTTEDVARAFLVPLYKISAQKDVRVDDAMKQDYYNETLQPHIEGIELLLDEALGLQATGMATEFEVDGLLRMDPKSRAETAEIGVRSATVTPNEARRLENRSKKTGGDSLYLQEQNFSLDALAKRDALENPWSARGTPSAAAPAANDPEQASMAEARELIAQIAKGLECPA